MIKNKKYIYIVGIGFLLMLSIYLVNQSIFKNTIYPNGKIDGPMNEIRAWNKIVACPPPLTPIRINGTLMEECKDPKIAAELVQNSE